MRSMSDDWAQSLLALAAVDRPASEWPGEPSSQEQQTGSYSAAVREAVEGLQILHVSDLRLGRRIPYDWQAFDFVLFTGDLSTGEHPGARAEAALPRSDHEVVALRGKIAALEEEQHRLREQLRRLEGKLDEILSTPGEMGTLPVDLHTRWIQGNLERLRQYPDEWIALHPVRGILFHTADGDEFAGMLDGLSADERDEVLAFHSSMYI